MHRSKQRNNSHQPSLLSRQHADLYSSSKLGAFKSLQWSFTSFSSQCSSPSQQQSARQHLLPLWPRLLWNPHLLLLLLPLVLPLPRCVWHSALAHASSSLFAAAFRTEGISGLQIRVSAKNVIRDVSSSAVVARWLAAALAPKYSRLCVASAGSHSEKRVANVNAAMSEDVLKLIKHV